MNNTTTETEWKLLEAGDALAKSGVKIFNSGQAMKTSRATYANQAHLVSAWQKRWRALAREVKESGDANT